MPVMIVACVWVGDKYRFSYVERLQRMVARHLPMAHRFVVLTDKMWKVERAGFDAVDVRMLGLPGWWAKMALFQHSWRAGLKVLYLDLDTVVVGDLVPLATLAVDFGICANFTRAAGNMTWPCNYGSCVMLFGPSMGNGIWDEFGSDRIALMTQYERWGDQRVIEAIYPDAQLLQPLLPTGFFLGYRDLPANPTAPPADCSIVVFAGRNKPHDCQIEWVRDAWER